MNKVYILIGGNIGAREKIFSEARELVQIEVGEIITISSLYETEPWGFNCDQPFLNQVMLVHTRYSALDTLSLLLHIEKKLGRSRYSNNYESRTIDLDILLYNNSIISEEQLKIPHPKMHHRLFTLIPLNEIAPDKKHPVLKQTIRTLKNNCPDALVVNLYNPVN